MFAGFDTISFETAGAVINARAGGQGAPLLLLHGYPQTHVLWHDLAPDLARDYQVVCADLRGYGDSRCLDGDYTFRAMARDLVALMAHLGHGQFHVAAHDRGARVAHRMVLDHPGAVLSVALLDILPTLDVWRTMDDWLAKRYWHWPFLAQSGDLPRKMIGADPVGFMHAALAGLSGKPDMFGPAALAEYERCAKNPDVIAAWCGDYAAAAGPDLDHDRADLGRVLAQPCLVLWGSRGAVAHHINPLEAWRAWFPGVQGHALEAGHFLIEERGAEVLSALRDHLMQVS